MTGAEQVVIVGGGVAGLACAVALADRGFCPIVLEQAPRLGGRASSWVHAPSGDVVDIGPHVLHSEYRNFPAFLERLGTRGHVTWQPRKLITIGSTRPVTRLVHRPLPTPFSLMPDLARAPGLTAKDLASNTRVTWRALQFLEEDVAALDGIDALAFLRAQRVSPGMIDWFWRFASMAVMNTPLEQCSAAALMRVHSQLIGHRGLHFGFPAVGLGELFTEQARAVVEGVGGRVLLGHRACALQAVDGMHHVVLDDGTRVQGRYLVLALPPPELHRLRPGLAETRAFEPSPYVSVYLWFDRPLGDERFWALLWSPARMNYDFYDLSRIRPAWAGRPSVTASNIIDSARADGLDDDAIVRTTVDEIAIFAPAAREARVVHADVHRIPYAIFKPAPGIESSRPPARTAIERIYLAGDWLRTALPSSMESATCGGWMAAEEILRDAGRAERLTLPVRKNDALARLPQWLAERRRGD